MPPRTVAVRSSCSPLLGLACALLLALASAVPLHAQSTASLTADAWTAAVDAYVEGRHAEAALQIARFDAAATPGVVRSTADTWQADGTADAGRRLKAAAALSFELAISHAAAGADDVSSRYLDAGRDAIRRLEAGERAARGTGPTDASAWRAREFAAVWRVNHLQLLLLTRQLSQVDRAAQGSDVDLLDDTFQAEWHLARGIARETASRLWLAADTPPPRQTFGMSSATSRDLWIERARGEAIRHYRQALAAQPSHGEANLRMGRVLFEQGQSDQARAHLERATTEPCRDAVCGLAWLFLGELHAERDAGGRATHAYLRASGVIDVRQSALIGLLRLSMREKPSVAVEMTRQFDANAMLGRVQAPDAWARYLSAQVLRLPVFLTALRAEVRR
jgi:tetratricopeptide (TPR) repeat protein